MPKISKKFCQKFSSIAVTNLLKKPSLKRLRCKQWDCAYCAEINRKYWRYQIVKYLSDNPDLTWSFHTFTMARKFHRSKYGTERSIEFIKRNWDILMKRIKRKYGKFQYVRVIEFHKSGIPHIHLLASFTIPDHDIKNADNPRKSYIAWLKKDLPSLGYGYMTNSQNAIGSGKQTAMYITKYMTKTDRRILDLSKLKKLRLIQTSRGIKKPNPKSSETWKIRMPLTEDDFKYIESWLDLDIREEIVSDDRDIYGYYPHIRIESEK